MPLDPDTKFCLLFCPFAGAIGSLCERLVTYLKTLTDMALHDQIGMLHGKMLEIGFFVVAAAIVSTAAMLLFPINLQNRRQVIGTAIVFGMLWPSVMDKLLKAGNIALGS
jgi:hypothetical protein